MIEKCEINDKICNPWLFILEDTAIRIELMTRFVTEAWGKTAFELNPSAPRAISRLGELYSRLEVISLDYDLFSEDPLENPGVGMDVVLWLEKQPPTANVIIHSANGPAAGEMFNRLDRAGFQVRRVFPMKDDSWIQNDWLPEVRRLKEWRNPSRNVG